MSTRATRSAGQNKNSEEAEEHNNENVAGTENDQPDGSEEREHPVEEEADTKVEVVNEIEASAEPSNNAASEDVEQQEQQEEQQDPRTTEETLESGTRMVENGDDVVVPSEPSQDEDDIRVENNQEGTAPAPAPAEEEAVEETKANNIRREHEDNHVVAETPAPGDSPGKPKDDLMDVPEMTMTPVDPEVIKQQELIDASSPTTELEVALYETLKRRDAHIERLTNEVGKLRAFISKRKQTYKRKRKDESAPTRALSAYNIFVQDRFSRLAKENEQALKSADTDAQLKRVPPASLVASTGNEWKELSAEEKAHYEERAREDRKRYEEQMAKYQPPDKQANRKRNKTGYNMFFSAHVLRLKQSEAGVPSERGSVARLVGNAWKQLSGEEKQFYEREADKQNGMNPVDKDDDDDDDIDGKRGPPMAPYDHHYMHQGDMHMHMGPPMHNMHQPPPPHQHDPRHQHYAPYPPMHYGQPYPGYHDQSAQGRAHAGYHQGRSHGYHQGYPPPPPRHYHENNGMTM